MSIYGSTYPYIPGYTTYFVHREFDDTPFNPGTMYYTAPS